MKHIAREANKFYIYVLPRFRNISAYLAQADNTANMTAILQNIWQAVDK